MIIDDNDTQTRLNRVQCNLSTVYHRLYRVANSLRKRAQQAKALHTLERTCMIDWETQKNLRDDILRELRITKEWVAYLEKALTYETDMMYDTQMNFDDVPSPPSHSIFSL